MLDQMLREHPPGTMSLVHPMFGDVDYGPLDEFTRFKVVVDGQDMEIVVYTMQSEQCGILRVWYLLNHELFTERVKTAPYPSSMTKVKTLRYFSLWNQAVALLLSELRPDVYHCMDYHASMAPLYLSPEKQLPVILVLHNADYMGISARLGQPFHGVMYFFLTENLQHRSTGPRVECAPNWGMGCTEKPHDTSRFR